ncbi:sensor histidine kinase [Nocardiopsis mangrovi]|uniref:histidine kinase n=1 Tax=Nocardiopsis mangrovi TaxID=1179818 RepID=A0ABV9E2Q8_9ACTN
MGDDTVQRRAFRPGVWPLRIGRWLWDRRHGIVDWALAIGLFPIWVFTVIELPNGPFKTLVDRIDTVGTSDEAAVVWVAIAFGGATAVSLATLFRRSRPAVLLSVAAVLAFGFGNGFPIALALYSYASWFSHRRRSPAVWTAAMVLGVIWICTYSYADNGGEGLAEAVIFVTVLVVALPVTAGLLVATVRRRLVENLHERAGRPEREQHRSAEQAVNGERSRVTGQLRPFPLGAWPPKIRERLEDGRHGLVDWALAIGLFPIWAGTMVELFSGPFHTLFDGGRPGNTLIPEDFAVIAIVLGGATVVSLATLLRRSRPAVLLSVAAVLAFGFGNGFPIALALYSYASWFSHRRRSLAVWTAAMVLGVIWIHVYSSADNIVGSSIFVTVLVVALPLTAGLWVGARRQLIGNLHERAERLEREQHLLAEQAINGERTRIAREMHDIVAHRVSLMVLHAGGLEVSTAESTTADTAGLIRTTGREALAELREILGVLRSSDDAAPTAPQPVLADLARLIGQWRTAGMPVEWVTTGTPRALPPRLERTAYRMVQEALTNAGKHAPGRPVTVQLGYGERDLEIVVANEPLPDIGPAVEPPPTSGYGLAGLRERIALAGGTLSAGPFPDGGWRVRAVVPIDGAVDEDEDG